MTAENSFVAENNITRVSAMQLINYFINRDTKSRNYMLEEVKKLKNKNYKLYIGTHQVLEKGQRLWFIENFNDYFLDMFTSYNIGYMKSEVEFFNEVSERIGIEKSETILIDDKQKNVDTAISAGWQGYLYESFDKIKSELFERL